MFYPHYNLETPISVKLNLMKGKTRHLLVIAMCYLCFGKNIYQLKFITTSEQGKPVNSVANYKILPINKGVFEYKVDSEHYTINFTAYNVSIKCAPALPSIYSEKVNQRFTRRKFWNVQGHDTGPFLKQKRTRGCYFLKENSNFYRNYNFQNNQSLSA